MFVNWNEIMALAKGSVNLLGDEEESAPGGSALHPPSPLPLSASTLTSPKASSVHPPNPGQTLRAAGVNARERS